MAVTLSAFIFSSTISALTLTPATTGEPIVVLLSSMTSKALILLPQRSMD